MDSGAASIVMARRPFAVDSKIMTFLAESSDGISSRLISSKMSDLSPESSLSDASFLVVIVLRVSLPLQSGSTT